jgi:hypothetical protein
MPRASPPTRLPEASFFLLEPSLVNDLDLERQASVTRRKTA